MTVDKIMIYFLRKYIIFLTYIANQKKIWNVKSSPNMLTKQGLGLIKDDNND